MENEWIEALKSAQAEVNSVVAKCRVHETPTRSIPSSGDRNWSLNEEVIVYSETES